MPRKTPPSADQAPVLVWLRNDLRLADNPALNAAVGTQRPLLCLYVFEDGSDGLRPLGGASKWWLNHSLTSLNADLRGIGGGLHVFRGAAHPILMALAAALRPSAIFWNRRYLGREIAVDTKIKTDLAEAGVEVRSFNGTLLHEPWEVVQKNGSPYKVYTPYWRAAQAKGRPHDLLPAPKTIPAPQIDLDAALGNSALRPRAIEDLDLLPRAPDWAAGWSAFWHPGEAGAAAALQVFLDRALPRYETDRSMPGIEGSSALSPHLRFGEVSPRQVAAAVGAASTAGTRHSVTKFLQELVWRDFCYNLIFHAPYLPESPFNPRFADFPYLDPEPAMLKAWQQGRTGYPIVDAGMRQLWQTGFMHNRVRMITASFLTKHLMTDWRIGEAWFWDTLVDADPANNAVNWQWVAGCGPDAAPYFRIFNPVLQGEKFDPEGIYVQRFVPELKTLEPRYKHQPWQAPAAVLAKAKVRLGTTYPKPMIDHEAARARALAALATLRGTTESAEPG